MNNPLKSITINGELKRLELSSKICFNYCSLNQGIWEIAISDLSYSSIVPLPKNLIIQISSNLVNGYAFSETNSLIFKNITMQTFEILESQIQGVIYFSPRWYTINNLNENIAIYLKPWPTNNVIIPNDFKLACTILLKRLV